MRALVGLGLFLASCDLLPHNHILCTMSDRCDSIVPAPFVLGQPDNGTNRYTAGMNTPVGVALTADGKLVVADTGSNRLLIWNTFPTRNNQSVDYVIGIANPSLACCTAGEFINQPLQISADPGHLVVTNSMDSLFIYQPFPSQHTKWSGSWSLKYFTTPINGRNMSGGSPLVVGNRLYMSDAGDNRLLSWDTPPLTSTSATAVIGQVDFTGTAPNGITGSRSNRSLDTPTGSPASDGTQLVVPDAGNNRVLIFSTLPTGNTSTAQWALGQTTFALGNPNQGNVAPDLTTLAFPDAVALSGAHLAVVDSGNSRVLLWNNPISMMAQPADVLLGQPAKSGNSPNAGGISAARMNLPRNVATDGNRLVVSDTGNHRVLIWNTWPTQSSVPADLILGQPAPDSNVAGGIVTSDNLFRSPGALAQSTSGFYVSDSAANRVLIYAGPPTAPADRPVAVLGQPDFLSDMPNNVALSASSLSSPEGIGAENGTVAVADTGNNRVLVWTNIAKQTQQPADIVLGQPSMTTGLANNTAPSQGLNGPKSVFISGGKVYVADTNNNRVLIWNSVPTKNAQTPDVVLGQADLITISPNRGGVGSVSALTLSNPTAVVADATSIYVCDTGSHRVLVWKTLTPKTGQPADLVLGQVDFTGYMPPLTPLDTGLGDPQALAIHNDRLYIVDRLSHRVVYYDTRQLRSGSAATGVVGQADLFSGNPNNGGLSANVFYTPLGVLALDNGIYIADTGNSRVVALPPIP